MKRVIILIILVPIVVLVAEIIYYTYTNYYPHSFSNENTSVLTPTSASENNIKEQSHVTPSWKSAIKFPTDMKNRVEVKGEVITAPWLEADQGYMEISLTFSDSNKSLPLTIFFGSANWLYGYSIVEGKWEAGDFAKIKPFIQKGTQVELWIRMGVDEAEVNEIIQSGKCDRVCKDKIEVARNWEPKNNKIIEDILNDTDNNVSLSKKIILGPIAQIRIVE